MSCELTLDSCGNASGKRVEKARKAWLVRFFPKKPSSRARTSGNGVRPCQPATSSARLRRINTSTNTSACRNSSAVGGQANDTPTYKPILKNQLQNRPCERLSNPSSPKRANGRKPEMPPKPSVRMELGSRPGPTSEGSTNVKNQIPNPTSSPSVAPRRVPPFQYRPPSTAGTNCATAAKDTKPVFTSGSCLPTAT